MKKLQRIAIILLTTSLLISCQQSKGVSKPDDLGTYAFDILKNLEKATKNSFTRTLSTYEELKAFGERNAETLSSGEKKNFERLKKDDYENRIGRDYHRLKERAREAGISWDAIEYSDYTSENTGESDAMEILLGTLTFTHNDQAYNVRIIGALMEGRYQLIRLFRMNTVKN